MKRLIPCARNMQALARQAACLLLALPIQYIIEESKRELEMHFLQVFDADSFLHLAFLHLSSSENDNKKWKQWTLALHYSRSASSTQNSGCSSSSWRLIVWFWRSALEAMQGRNLTACHLERGRQSVAQMSRSTATAGEQGSVILAVLLRHQLQ